MPRKFPSGQDRRVRKKHDQVFIELPNAAVKERIHEFCSMYEHTGVGKSRFLLALLLDAASQYDAERGGAWANSPHRIELKELDK